MSEGNNDKEYSHCSKCGSKETTKKEKRLFTSWPVTILGLIVYILLMYFLPMLAMCLSPVVTIGLLILIGLTITKRTVITCKNCGAILK